MVRSFDLGRAFATCPHDYCWGHRAGLRPSARAIAIAVGFQPRLGWRPAFAAATAFATSAASSVVLGVVANVAVSPGVHCFLVGFVIGLAIVGSVGSTIKASQGSDLVAKGLSSGAASGSTIEDSGSIHAAIICLN